MAEASTENNPASFSEGDEDKDEDDDDDDWDTFQSFSASTREAITDDVAESHETEDSEVLESSISSVKMEDSTPLSVDELRVENKEHGETSEEVSMSTSPTGQRSPVEDLKSEGSSGMQEVGDPETGNVDIVLKQEDDTENETLPEQELNQVTEQVLSRVQLAEGVEVSAIISSLEEDHKPVDESPKTKTEPIPSDHEILDDEADNEHVREHKEGNEKDTVAKTSSIDNEQRNDSS